MSRRPIERQEWPAFVDGFSRRHDAWLISIAIEEGAGARRYLVRDVPLRGVVAEGNGGAGSIMVLAGEQPYATHFVNGPVSLTVGETADGSETELIIGEASGARTIVEFRTPMRPELVDGVV